MIDFLKYRWLSAFFSIVIMGTFVSVYAYKYFTNPNHETFNYSVDFTGGIQALLQFNKPVETVELIKILDENGWPGTTGREFSKLEHLIRVKKEAKNIAKESDDIKETLISKLPEGYTIKVLKTDSVGSSTGSSLREKSKWAILISLLAILLYITLRFWSLGYAAGAIVSLFHDALVILTIFLIFNKEISINVIGAILVVLGYSINDTIVIFARIRENIGLMPSASMYDIINKSINDTLRRTILTTISTMLVVISLLVFGGETLRDLSSALLIGMVFGIYSTIFIATPVLYAFYKDDKKLTIK